MKCHVRRINASAKHHNTGAHLVWGKELVNTSVKRHIGANADTQLVWIKKEVNVGANSHTKGSRWMRAQHGKKNSLTLVCDVTSVTRMLGQCWHVPRILRGCFPNAHLKKQIRSMLACQCSLLTCQNESVLTSFDYFSWKTF